MVETPPTPPTTPNTAISVVVKRPRSRRLGPIAAVSQGVRQGLAGARALLGAAYATGARGILDRKEGLEDRLATRQARRTDAHNTSITRTGL